MILTVNNTYSSFNEDAPQLVYDYCSKDVMYYRKTFPKACFKCNSRNIILRKMEYYCKDCQKEYSCLKREFETVTLIENHNWVPTGLAGEISRLLKQNGQQVKIIDNRVRPNKPPYPKHKDIQIREQVDDCSDIFINRTRGILQLATAVGKTRIAADIIQKLGVGTLYVVPNKGLLTQTKQELSEFIDTSIGVVGGSFNDIQTNEDGTYTIPNILIITVQSLWSILKRHPELFDAIVERTEFLIIDEAHHVRYKRKTKIEDENPWNTWFIISMKLKNAYYRLGLTATPYNKEDLGRMMLEASTGIVQYEYNRAEAQEDKVVVPFDAWIYEVHCQASKSWQRSYKFGIVENEEHTAGVINGARALVALGRKVVVLFDEKERHLFEIAKKLPEAAVLTGDDEIDVRDDVKKRFIAGEIPIILSTVLSEGVNIPEIDGLVNAAAKGSDKTVRVRLPQWVGRGSRNAEGKKDLIVIDFLHKGNETLNKHSKNRIDVYNELGGNIIYKGRVHQKSALMPTTKNEK